MDILAFRNLMLASSAVSALLTTSSRRSGSNNSGGGLWHFHWQALFCILVALASFPRTVSARPFQTNFNDESIHDHGLQRRDGGSQGSSGINTSVWVRSTVILPLARRNTLYSFRYLGYYSHARRHIL